MGLYPKATDPLALGLPVGPNSNVYYVDGTNGDDDNTGLSPLKPMATVAAAEDKCVANQHDVVALISGATSDSPSASIAWDKNFTHLVGLGPQFPGIGQRSRIVGSAAADLTPVITFSGRGCIVRDVQFQNGKDAASDSGCVIVSGPYNLFERVYFNGMNDATPAARAGSYCLSVTGAENVFRDCTIGSCQTIRAAANAEMIVSNGANRWEHCEFQTYSETSGKFLVTVDASGNGLGNLIFDDCLFYCQTVNWGTGIANAFHITGSHSHFVILRRNCQLVGVGLGWADVVTHVYGAGAQPNAGMGVSTNPTT